MPPVASKLSPKKTPAAKPTTNGVNTAAPAKKRKKQEKESQKATGPIIYDSIKAVVCQGEKSLTYDQMKEILGYEEETEGKTFGKHFLFKNGDKKVRTTKNLHNRDFQMPNALLVKQEVLRRKWKLNGETLIIGDRGSVLSAQHRGVGFLLAVEEWRKDPEAYPLWKTEPTLDCVIVYGISEDDDVVNTIDTGRPRTLANVIFRSIYFADVEPSERKNLARSTQYAIRRTWDRTGANKNAFDPGLFRTHAEAIDFLKRHPRILECVKHVHEENTEGRIASVMRSLGDAAALLYLMGCDQSTNKDYIEGDPPNEKLLNWKSWDKAQDFWLHIGQGSKSLDAIPKAVANVLSDSEGQREASTNERLAIVIKAWNIYRTGEIPTPKDLKLEYKENDDGVKQLLDFPTVGGIDLGKELYDEVIEDETTEDDIKEQAAALRKKALHEKANGNGAHKPNPSGPMNAGDKVWVVEENGGHWSGKLVDNIKGGKALVKISPGFAGAGSVKEVKADKLQKNQPIPK